MSINPISQANPTNIPTVEDDMVPQDAIKEAKPLSQEELHKNLVETNTRYIFDQMIRSTQHFTQEMIRQSKEREKEDNERG